MVRLLIIICLVVIGLVFAWGFWTGSGVRTADQLIGILLKMQDCVSHELAEQSASARDRDYLASFGDYDAYRVYSEQLARQAEARCIEESDFKSIVLQVLDQTDIDETEKTRLKRDVMHASSMAEIEIIVEEMKGLQPAS